MSAAWPPYRTVRVGLRRPVTQGYIAALCAVLITAAYPALTRISVTSTLTPADLLLLRLGVGGLLFAPWLWRRRRMLTRAEWQAALPLSMLQGWGMAGCVVFGLRFAPASHAAALGPGAIAAWIALVGFLACGIRVAPRRLAGMVVIVAGVLLMLVASGHGHAMDDAIIGDALFLAASAQGACYLVYVQRRRLDPVLAAALVCVASAMLIVPWHTLFAASTLATAPAAEIAWQLVFQGFVVGGVAFLALNFAALTIGSQALGVMSALVPVFGAIFAALIAGDALSSTEWLAIVVISLGVFAASLPAGRAQPKGVPRRSVAPLGHSTVS
jgi:drug/metabolite transporter (DMT)-like permease